MHSSYIKTRGAIFKRFCDDPCIWRDGAYLDGASIFVDGRRTGHVPSEAPPHAEVIIVGGFMCRTMGRVPLQFFFQSWRVLVDDPREAA